MSAAPAEDPGHTGQQAPRWWWSLDAVAVAVILPSILSGTARWWWIGDLCVHFRLPYAIALLLLAIVYLSLGRRRWLMAVSIVLGVNVSLLWPLFAGPSSVDQSQPDLRVMTANVFIGNTNPRPVLRAVQQERPDVLLLMEIDQRWLDDLEALRDDYPYCEHAIRDEGFGEYGPFGMAVFSRQPLRESQVHRLGTARVPVIVTTVMQDQQPWTIIAAHPYPPISAACAEARDTFLAELGQIVARLDGPKVLLGDLNVTRWSPHFCDLLSAGGLEDSELGWGYQATWPNVFSMPLIPIDHVLISEDVAVIRRRVGPSIASDHRPVIAELGLRPSQ